MLSAAAGSVALRSGIAVNNAGNSNLSALYPMIVGVPLPFVGNANKYPLWTSLNNQGIYVSKPNTGVLVGELWWVAADV
jgi:hypothetical protein